MATIALQNQRMLDVLTKAVALAEDVFKRPRAKIPEKIFSQAEGLVKGAEVLASEWSSLQNAVI